MDVPGDCLAKFKSNRVTGWLLLAGILAGSAWVHAWLDLGG